MAVRAKVRRSTPRRRTVAVASKSLRSGSAARRGTLNGRKTRVVGKRAASHGNQSIYARAIRFLNTLADYERQRIVRYNPQNFDLDRMRTLLRKLGNPQEHFRSVHIAGTKGKGSTCAMVAA